MHTKAFSLVKATSRWAGLYLDFVASLFISVVSIGTLVFSMDSGTDLFINVLHRFFSAQARNKAMMESKEIL